jgi:TetR/AcrR family transcriptional regulator, repressor for uid operon
MTAVLPARPVAQPSGDLRDPERAASIEARVVEATLTCIARHGLSKTTVDDVARAAGCSRATLYRYFDSKPDLVRRVIAAEASRIVDCCRREAADAETLEDAVVAVLLVAGRELVDHPALRFVADHECELLLPYLTFSGGDRFLADAATAIVPCIEPHIGHDARRAAEWVARLGLALWLSPTAPVSLHDDDAVRDYVRVLVVPALTRSIDPDASRSPVTRTRGTS